MRFKPLATEMALSVGFTRKVAPDRRIRRLGGYVGRSLAAGLSGNRMSLIELGPDWRRDSPDGQIEAIREQRGKEFPILLTYVSK